MKIKVAVLFGGRSTEHEISVISAIQAIGSINKERYEAIYNISLQQRDYIRRLMPIIPKKKEKTK